MTSTVTCCILLKKTSIVRSTADCRAIDKIKQQKKDFFEAKAGQDKKSLAFLCKEINALKRKLKPEKTASSRKRKAESILSTEINLTTSSDEGEGKKQEYLFTSSKPFSSSKTKLTKSYHPTITHYVGSKSHCQQ
jgi:hypothetical protein